MNLKTLIAAAVAAAFAVALTAQAEGNKASSGSSSSGASAGMSTSPSSGSASGGASGEAKSDGGAAAMFKKLDKNNDGFISKEEAKGKKHARTIYFPTERSLDVIRRLAAERPSGMLLVNRRGNPWTGMAVVLL